MSEPPRWILRNASSRPVELHRPEGVVVLPPRGTVEAGPTDPATAALERRGVLTRHAAPPPEPEPLPEEADTAADAADDAGEGGEARTSRRASRKSSRHPQGGSA